jgi:uncharacterized membrane protein YgdD (TMEM256/DUF423 family)
MQRFSAILGCAFAFFAVVLGAFGAHALKSALAESGGQATWQTAVDYHLWHALALVLCGCFRGRSRALVAASVLFAVGILLFSGSLYWLALDGPRWLGPVTPLGGLSFMGGWIALAIAFRRAESGNGD